MLKRFLLILVICITATAPLWAQSDEPDDSSGSRTLVSRDIISNFNFEVNDNARIMLSWKALDTLPDFFAIERSDNGNSFETVTILTNLNSKRSYQWTDESPKKGKGFYRIRYSFKEGEPRYSKTMSCLIEGYHSFRFYPNPVDQILIIRTEAPLEVTIVDATGKTRIPQMRISGLQTINVSALEKGIYLIRCVNKLSNSISQEKLIKN